MEFDFLCEATNNIVSRLSYGVLLTSMLSANKDTGINQLDNCVMGVIGKIYVNINLSTLWKPF